MNFFRQGLHGAPFSSGWQPSPLPDVYWDSANPLSVKIPPQVTPHWKRGWKTYNRMWENTCATNFRGLLFPKGLWEHLILHSNICQRIHNRSRFLYLQLTLKHDFFNRFFIGEFKEIHFAKNLGHIHIQLCFGQFWLLFLWQKIWDYLYCWYFGSRCGHIAPVPIWKIQSISCSRSCTFIDSVMQRQLQSLFMKFIS